LQIGIRTYGRIHQDCARVEALGAKITARASIEGWPTLATALYARSDDEAALARARTYELAWSAYGARAELVELAGTSDHRALIAAKRELRREFCSQELGALSLHAFHVPDADRWMIERAIIFNISNW